MTIELKKIKQLIELFEQSNLTEIEIKEDKDSVRLSRQQAVQPIQISSSNYPNYPAVGSAAPIQNNTANANGAASASPTLDLTGHKICSPMVGTFYAAPTPDARPFVEVGQTVKRGDVLCIIEAMKMLNQIEADRAGVISKILIQNAEPVEYDQVLFIITE